MLRFKTELILLLQAICQDQTLVEALSPEDFGHGCHYPYCLHVVGTFAVCNMSTYCTDSHVEGVITVLNEASICTLS